MAEHIREVCFEPTIMDLPRHYANVEKTCPFPLPARFEENWLDALLASPIAPCKLLNCKVLLLCWNLSLANRSACHESKLTTNPPILYLYCSTTQTSPVQVQSHDRQGQLSCAELLFLTPARLKPTAPGPAVQASLPTLFTVAGS